MIIRRYLSFILLVLCAPMVGIGATMHYTVDIRHCETHSVHVTLKPEGFHAKTGVFQMPIWAPGAYSVTHYGQYVVNVKALDKNGKSLPVTQVNSDRWSIANGKAVTTIEYDVLDSHKDSTSLYFAMANMDTSLFFANATALFGYYDNDKNANATVDYLMPQGWKLACALSSETPGTIPSTSTSFANTHFYAKDYDELADAPVIAAPETAAEGSNHLVTRTFGEGSALYDVALATTGSFPKEKMDSLVFYLAKIVHAETDFFHQTPFSHYTFVIYAPTLAHMPTMAMGALEHANSSDYLLVNFGWSMFKGAFLSIFSHEFFHLWNVKRIHSSLLGPFDYTSRVMTTSLWLSEGITEYYANTLLSRYGIWTPARFYASINQWLQSYSMAPKASQAKSLEQLSIDESAFDLDEATIFYTKGPLVGLMLDLEIRNKTQNKKSLDDVMLALNEDAKHGKTFKDEDLIHLFEKYSGVDLTDFYNRYIHGTDSLPLDQYLALMGVSHGSSEGKASFSMNESGRLTLDRLDSTSTFAKAGIREGDIILAVNGTPLTLDNIERLSSLRDSLTSAMVRIERDGQAMDIPVTFTRLTPMTKQEGGMDVKLNATPLELAIRRGIVGQP